MLSVGEKQLGEILCKNGSLSQSQLKEALKKRASSNKQPLGQILVGLGYITEEQLSKAYVRGYGWKI